MSGTHRSYSGATVRLRAVGILRLQAEEDVKTDGETRHVGDWVADQIAQMTEVEKAAVRAELYKGSKKPEPGSSKYWKN